jgi:hypothetical protein
MPRVLRIFELLENLRSGFNLGFEDFSLISLLQKLIR